MRRSSAAIVLLVLLADRPGGVRADDPPRAGPGGEPARAAAALKLAQAQAALYRVHLEGPGDASATLQPETLLQWSNPVAGSIHGAVFAWTDRGCPVAVASIYKWFAPETHLGVELHALAPSVRSADRRDRPAWSPNGVAPGRRPIAGAPRPADNPAGRLRQLRALAGEFTASETTRDEVTRELRRLTQPVYRYASTDPDVIDGALFAFVEGTDPEIICAIEARRTPAGPEWQFAAARLNSLTLRLNHKGREAWTAPTIPWDQARDPREPYALFVYDDPGA